MELGILERLEKKFDSMENKIDAILGEFANIGSSIEGIEDLKIKESSPAPKVPEEPIASKEVPLEPVVEDELDELGFKWDKRIHSEKKGKTKAGLWKKVRGCDQKLYDQIMEEQAKDVPEPSTVPTPNKSAPPPPSPKNKIAPPPPPSPKVDPNEAEKQKAMESISALTTSHAIPFDRVLKELPTGVANFDALPPEQYKEFGLKVKTWVNWLGMCHDENLKVQELGGVDGINGMQIIYNFYDGATHANQISPENLSTVYDSLKEYREKWEEIQ